MAADEKDIANKLADEGLIDSRKIYCLGTLNKRDAGYLFGALGGMASTVNSMVYICLNGEELIITKLDLETVVFRRNIADIKIEKLTTGFLGGKLVYRMDGKRVSFDCSNDFVKAFAPIVGMKI